MKLIQLGLSLILACAIPKYGSAQDLGQGKKYRPTQVNPCAAGTVIYNL